jgi:hypothetical protein
MDAEPAAERQQRDALRAPRSLLISFWPNMFDMKLKRSTAILCGNLERLVLPKVAKAFGWKNHGNRFPPLPRTYAEPCPIKRTACWRSPASTLSR